MKRQPTVLERILASLALAVGFLLMASVFAPDFSHAQTDPVASPLESAYSSSDVHAGLISLGTLEDERYLVRIYGGEEDPRYSVYDRADGRPLGVLLSAAEAAEWFPELPIPDMDFGTDGPLMLAEPAFVPDF